MLRNNNNNNNNNNKERETLIKRETESLLREAQNNTIGTNYVEAKINRCNQIADVDKMINHIINKCSKLTQKEYKTRHAWVRKVIYWELCKKFKFDHTSKWYMHNPESVLENEIHKILREFENRSSNLGQTTRPSDNLQKKKREPVK